MSLSKKIVYQAASMIPMGILKQMGSPEILLPYHHLVSDEKNVGHIRHLYPYKNKLQFTKDLDYLLSNFKPLHPEDLIQAVKADRPLSPNSFLLTFDDGLREAYEVVAPILIQKGLPAVFFLNPAFLDNEEMFYRNKLSLVIDKLMTRQVRPGTISKLREILKLAKVEDPGAANVDAFRSGILSVNYLNRNVADRLGECLEISFGEYLKEVKPYMSTEQVKEMIRQGFHFGGHSLDHPNYKLLNLQDQLAQTRESCRLVKELFGLGYSMFSFPHEDAPVPQDFFNALAEEKHSAPDVLFGTQNQMTERPNRMFHRFNAERPDYPIGGLIKGLMLYNLERRATGRLRVIRTVPIDKLA